MSVNAVGYKLIKIEDNAVIEQWGGLWGQCPGIPNPVVLPNGDHVHAPSLDTDYQGYKLVMWEMDPPAPLTPQEKLANAGLTVIELKELLGLN